MLARRALACAGAAVFAAALAFVARPRRDELGAPVALSRLARHAARGDVVLCDDEVASDVVTLDDEDGALLEVDVLRRALDLLDVVIEETEVSGRTIAFARRRRIIACGPLVRRKPIAASERSAIVALTGAVAPRTLAELRSAAVSEPRFWLSWDPDREVLLLGGPESSVARARALARAGVAARALAFVHSARVVGPASSAARASSSSTASSARLK